MSKLKLGSGRLSRFVKLHGKRAFGTGVSPYNVASDLLTELGYLKPAHIIQPKAHCLAFAEVIWAATPSVASQKKTAEPQVQKKKARAFQRSTNNVASDAFLNTYEWRRVRMVALKRYGRVCQCCGASPMTGAVINVDHIKPRKLFPHLALDVDNLQILCHECNHGKGNWDMTDWRSADALVDN